jgi:hypothetical protein
MKPKDFEVKKTQNQFLRNYSLHDNAQRIGEEILSRMGYTTIPFGEDRRHESVWEAGEDKPDCCVTLLNDKSNILCLLDWKGKKSDGYRINERAYNSYINISKEINKKVLLAMAKFNDENKIEEFKFIIIPDESIQTFRRKEWDGNITINFESSSMRDFFKVNTFLSKLLR